MSQRTLQGEEAGFAGGWSQNPYKFPLKETRPYFFGGNLALGGVGLPRFSRKKKGGLLVGWLVGWLVGCIHFR